MKTALAFRRVLFPLFVAVGSCGGPTASSLKKPFEVVLRATSDEGQPVEGVRFANGASPLGTTDAKGTVATTIRGADGQTFPVTTSCPEGYIAPEQPTALRLTEVRRVDQVTPATIGIEVVCIRRMRDIVLVVRTSNAPTLPVEVAGKSVGNTDANGNAHVHLQLDREVRSVSASLGTATLPKLRPQNPSRVFELEGQDAVLLFDQSFSTKRAAPLKRRAVAAKEPTKCIPYRIDSGTSHAF